MKIIAAVFFSIALCFPSLVMARSSVPVINYPAVQASTGSGKTLTIPTIRKTIKQAAQANNWIVMEQPGGKLICSYSWNNAKHTIFVEITPFSEGYSLVYKDSHNMNYALSADERYPDMLGVPIIHPHYNRFVRALNEAIRREFQAQ